MEAAWAAIKSAAAVGRQVDPLNDTDLLNQQAAKVKQKCAEEQRLVERAKPSTNTSNERFRAIASYADHLPLGHFENFFELVPQLVNVVSLCEALPHPSSVGGGKLPLDLHLIAAKCRNSYFAPRRFAAIQLAFSTPRSRVLIFREPPSARPARAPTYRTKRRWGSLVQIDLFPVPLLKPGRWRARSSVLTVKVVLPPTQIRGGSWAPAATRRKRRGSRWRGHSGRSRWRRASF